jgi:hypothetical protein
VPAYARNERGLLDKVIEMSYARKPGEVELFHRSVLGLAYTSADNRLTPEALQAARSEGVVMVPGYAGSNPVTMGVDVATVRDLNVRISEVLPDGRSKRALWVGTVDSITDLDVLMERYRVWICVIDHQPDGTMARAFAQRFPGRVYVTHYAEDTQKDVVVPDDVRREASARRNSVFDTMLTEVRMRRNHIPLDTPEEYDRHMRAIVRKVERDEQTDKVRVHYISTGADDFAQAEGYDVVAGWLLTYRLKLAELTGTQVRPLDEMVPFQRTDLNDPEADEYRPGPDVGGYRPGFES